MSDYKSSLAAAAALLAVKGGLLSLLTVRARLLTPDGKGFTRDANDGKAWEEDTKIPACVRTRPPARP